MTPLDLLVLLFMRTHEARLLHEGAHQRSPIVLLDKVDDVTVHGVRSK